MEASRRRLLGRPVQLVLKFSGLFMGVVSHPAFTNLSLRLQACHTAGVLPSDRVVLSRPSAVLDPIRRPPGSVRLPVVNGYTHRLLPAVYLAAGAGEGLPSSCPHLRPSRFPYPGGFLSTCASRLFGAFRGLRRESSGSAPSCPLRASITGLQNSLYAAGWTIASPKGAFDAALRPWAFPPSAGNLLPGLLAAARSGLSPAGKDKLVMSFR